MTTPLPAVPSALTTARRRRDLARLADGWRPDVLVIGAGFTGTGVALDAATRGLSVAVIDRGDLAAGTSRWSSKLVHGGLRYLAHGNLGLARESAAERGVLMERVAPHLTRALTFVTPLNDGMPALSGVLSAVGYVAGNLLRITAGTRAATLPGPRPIGPARTAALVPAIGRDGLRGAWLNSDGQLVDDARYVVAIARTAAAFGAAVLPYVAASAVARDHATLTDTTTGDSFQARAARVVVAAGVWSDALDDRVRLRPSKGVHLVVAGAALGHPVAAVAAPVPGHLNRFALVLPQMDGRVYIGLTDDPVEGPIPEEPVVLEAERDVLLAAVNRVLDRPLTAADVIGGYAGYRPLVAGAQVAAADPLVATADPLPAAADPLPAAADPLPAAADHLVATADLSRAHLVLDEADGPITIVGGKLTTYRRMAADVVDRLTTAPCTTATQPLVGALPRTRLAELPWRPWLVGRYGAEAAAVEALLRADPALGEAVVPGLPYLRAELAFAVQREGAASAADLLDRRTRIGLVSADRAAALPVAQQILEDHLDRTP